MKKCYEIDSSKLLLALKKQAEILNIKSKKHNIDMIVTNPGDMNFSFADCEVTPVYQDGEEK